MKKPVASRYFSSMNVVGQIKNNPLEKNNKAKVSVDIGGNYDKLKPIDEVKEKNKKTSEGVGLIPARNRYSTKDVSNVKGKLNPKKNSEAFPSNLDSTGEVLKKKLENEKKK